jgi:hypothetical protein
LLLERPVKVIVGEDSSLDQHLTEARRRDARTLTRS